MTTESNDPPEALTPGIDGAEAAEGQSSDANPREGSKDALPAWLDWFLPDDSDHDGDGRTGFLSTYMEWHALIIGLAVGTHVAASGDMQLVADLIGVGAAGSRLQKGLPEKYVQQAKSELPYFLLGVGIAILGVHLSTNGLLPS